jgi:hypothetical protein
MKIIKIISTSLITLSLSSVAVIAQAAINAQDLLITNYTYKDSTVKINGKACSSFLGEIGITRARVRGKEPVPNKIYGAIVAGVCSHDPHNCRADIYMDDHCGGNFIGTVYLDTMTGIKPEKTDIQDKSYSIRVNGPFNVDLLGGPELIQK